MGRPRKKKEERFKELLAGIGACEPVHYIRDVLEKEIRSLTLDDFENAVTELSMAHLADSQKKEILRTLDLFMRNTRQRERRRLL